MKIAFFDVSYHRTSHKDGPSSWPVNMISYVSMDSGRADSHPSEHSLRYAPHRNSRALDEFLADLIHDHDIIVGHGVEGDYNALGKVSNSADKLPQMTVDTQKALWDSVIEQFPRKRHFGAGMRLDKLYLQTRNKSGIEVPTKSRGEDPTYDCWRVASLWRYCMTDSLLYDHAWAGHGKENRDTAIIPACKDSLTTPNLTGLELCHPLEWPNAIKESVNEFDDQTLNYSVSFIKGATQGRIRDRVGNGDNLSRQDVESIKKSLKWGRHPELMMTLTNEGDPMMIVALKNGISASLYRNELDAERIPYLLDNPGSDESRSIIENYLSAIKTHHPLP